jgi:hypothetical protein
MAAIARFLGLGFLSVFGSGGGSSTSGQPMFMENGTTPIIMEDGTTPVITE